MPWSGEKGEHCRDSALRLGEAESKTCQISALSLEEWSVGAWGLSQGVPKGPEVPQQLRIGICQRDNSREQRHQCPNICRS